MAIETECAIRTVGTEIKILGSVASTRVIAASAQFHIGAARKIDRVFAIDRPIRVVHFLRSHCGRGHVAVFIPRTVDGVVAIVTLRIEDAQPRDSCTKLAYLLKHWLLRIECLSVGTRVKAIRPEALMTEDRSIFIRRINRNDMLLTRATRVLVIMFVIPKRQPTLLTTCRTVCRQGDGERLARNNRREALDHCFIISSHAKWPSTGDAVFFHK